MSDDDKDTVAFTIRIPIDAEQMIVNGLIPFGLFGKTRASICRHLIVTMLSTAEMQANVEKGLAKVKKD